MWTLADGLTVTVPVDQDCETLRRAELAAANVLEGVRTQLERSTVPMVDRYPEEGGVSPDRHPAWAFLVLGQC